MILEGPSDPMPLSFETSSRLKTGRKNKIARLMRQSGDWRTVRRALRGNPLSSQATTSMAANPCIFELHTVNGTGGTRTLGLPLRRRSLYPSELQPQINLLTLPQF